MGKDERERKRGCDDEGREEVAEVEVAAMGRGTGAWSACPRGPRARARVKKERGKRTSCTPERSRLRRHTGCRWSWEEGREGKLRLLRGAGRQSSGDHGIRTARERVEGELSACDSTTAGLQIRSEVNTVAQQKNLLHRQEARVDEAVKVQLVEPIEMRECVRRAGGVNRRAGRSPFPPICEKP